MNLVKNNLDPLGIGNDQSIFFIIPAFNESTTIGPVVKSIVEKGFKVVVMIVQRMKPHERHFRMVLRSYAILLT